MSAFSASSRLFSLAPVPFLLPLFHYVLAGTDPGGAGPGGQEPPLFWGTPKLHKEEKNVGRVRAEMPHFSS